VTDDDYGEIDEGLIFRALADHDVDFVVVGGGAALLWGAERATRDIDCVARQTTENYRRLCAALGQMGRPRLRIEGVDDRTAEELSKQLLHPDFFARTAASTWRTDAGSIDVLAAIPDLDGADVGYAALRDRATHVPTREVRVPIASLDDIINSKRHADRVKDREALPELIELRQRLQRKPD
jgi:hypothetical protein